VSILLAAAVKQNAAVLTIAAGLDPVVRPPTPARRPCSTSQPGYGVLLFSIQHSAFLRLLFHHSNNQTARECILNQRLWPSYNCTSESLDGMNFPPVGLKNGALFLMGFAIVLFSPSIARRLLGPLMR
jgi:hypothetical protein